MSLAPSISYAFDTNLYRTCISEKIGGRSNVSEDEQKSIQQECFQRAQAAASSGAAHGGSREARFKVANSYDPQKDDEKKKK